MARARLEAFRIFVMMLGIWTGAGLFESIYSHPAWYADPVGWVRSAGPAPAGAGNPWPILTILFALATLAALALDWRGRSGGRPALVALIGAIAVLAATGVYFVPTLIALGDAGMSEAEIAATSRTWIVLNVARIALLIGLFYAALAALGRHHAAAAAAGRSSDAG